MTGAKHLVQFRCVVYTIWIKSYLHIKLTHCVLNRSRANKAHPFWVHHFWVRFDFGLDHFVAQGLPHSSVAHERAVCLFVGA